MAVLLRDGDGVPVPQHSTEQGSFEMTQGRGGALNVNVVSEAPRGIKNTSTVANFNVSASATLIPTTEITSEVRVNNTHSADVFVGFSAAVTTTSGYPVKPGDEITLPMAGGSIYVVSTSAGTIRVMVI